MMGGGGGCNQKKTEKISPKFEICGSVRFFQRWLWFRTARGLQLKPPCACAAAVVGGWCWWCPLRKLFSVEHGVVPRAPTDALQLWRVRGCVRRAYFATEIYMNLYYLITVVNKIIVFLK